jgi:hypothetical protein
MLRIPHLDNRLTGGGKVRPHFTPRKLYSSNSRTNFCYKRSESEGHGETRPEYSLILPRFDQATSQIHVEFGGESRTLVVVV